RITLTFLIIGIIYILFSDWLLLQIVRSTEPVERLNELQSVKGIAFVVITSGVIFLLAQRELRVQRKYIQKLEKQKTALVLSRYEVEKTQKDLNLIFNNSEELIATVSFDGYIKNLNPAWTRKLGWTVNELMKVPWINFIHPDDVDKSRIRNERLSHGESTLYFTHRFRKKNGDYAFLSWNVIPLDEEQIVFGIGRDITKKIVADRELAETKNLLERTINNLNEAVFVINPSNRKIQIANDIVRDMYGYNKEELIGKNTRILHINEEKYQEFAALSEPKLKEKKIFQTEFQMRRKNGELFDTENIVSAIYDNKGWRQGVVSVVRDITERKRAQKSLEEYQESLKQLTIELSLAEEKEKKKIAANIHDHLSQSLVVSRMKLKNLLSESMSENMKKEIDSISKLISEALTSSRKITYDLSPPVLYELGIIETMYWMTEKIANENTIKTSFHSEFEEISLHESELILLFRIIQEIIHNSVKHARAGKIAVNFYKHGNNLKIIIEDDGVGFDTGILTENKKMTGFGLFAVGERIRNLSGEFKINSAPGKGTRAEIFVPLNESI
ncbi:MAG: PAS domain-containing sensor histidine kinase, partial [Bacteroidota bacterium]